MTAAYGWAIDTDHLETGAGDAGRMGPRDIPDGIRSELDDGQGRTFRIYDDDGEHYYTGRIVAEGIGSDGDPVGADDGAFGPLWDFGEPNAGATEIRYQVAGRWETL